MNDSSFWGIWIILAMITLVGLSVSGLMDCERVPEPCQEYVPEQGEPCSHELHQLHVDQSGIVLCRCKKD